MTARFVVTGQLDRLTGVVSADGGHVEGSGVTGQQGKRSARDRPAWPDRSVRRTGQLVPFGDRPREVIKRTGQHDRSPDRRTGPVIVTPDPRGQPLTGQPDGTAERTTCDFLPPWRAQDLPVSKVVGSVNGWRTARVVDGPFLLSGQRWRLMIDPDVTVGTLGDPGHDRIGTLLAETGQERWRMVRVQRCDVSELLCEARKDKRNVAYVTDSIVASILANPDRRRDERRSDR